MAMNPLSERQNHAIIVPSMKNKGGAIVSRPSKYDNMSKEEILAAMRERQKKNASYQWKKTCTLTLQEGETLENDFLAKFECDNVSQFLKKIVHGELIVSPAEPSESN
jgi:hypothetical protein